MNILSTSDLKKVYGSGENEVHALDGVKKQWKTERWTWALQSDL